MHIFSQLLFSIFVLSLASIAPSALASNDIAFSKNKIFKMKNAKEWSNQTITYEKSVGVVDLSVSLDQQQYPYLEPIISEYAQTHQVKIAISDGTCGITAGKLKRKEVDIGGYCCPPGKLDRLPEVRFHTLGIASLAIIAHADNSVSNMTQKQAKQVFSGDVSRWDDIDKENTLSNITPVIRPHCAKRPGHWRALVKNKSEFSGDSLKTGAIPDMLSQTSKSEGAIGYETLWWIAHHSAVAPVKILNIDGFNPKDNDALAKGDYPFYRTFSLTTWDGKNSKPLADDLVAWLMNKINTTPNGPHTMVGSNKLRANGWLFKGNELIGSPHNSRLPGSRI